MSIFGSREDDPLLQNDPLSPSPEEPDASDDASASNDADANSSHPADAHTNSVFSGPARSAPDAPGGTAAGPPDSRTLTCPLDAVLDGRLPELSAMLDEGWRLAEVRLQRAAPGETSSPPSARQLVFVLRAPHPS